ncbi:MAG: hypothetical protein WBJ54_05055 [Syntrophorhabdus sp.]
MAQRTSGIFINISRRTVSFIPGVRKINAYIERYHRTVQEEFIDHHIHLLPDEELFNKELAKYLIF